ncbi:superoxide dismutase [Clostridium sp. HBUAS56010]|uniref:superoxide dismutase n=1 Tax=Clostridium sp. HBUAS56010 TaxID=2571127 RepID=UPI001177C66B|nr:superoxide dismutase [Clostridium sp. HBUAS56010]
MNEHFPFVNPPLPYAYDALEPYIDTQTMYFHHDRHLQRYVAELNAIIRDYPELQNLSLIELITQPEILPEEVRQPILDYAGGVYNHILYFNGMTNSLNRSPADELYPAIIRDFGTLEDFFNKYKQKALSVFGSGFAWLVVAPDGTLEIVTTRNQDSPIVDGYCIVMSMDVWEHAYYLRKYNDRASYIEDWFHVINWEVANELYKQCINTIQNTTGDTLEDVIIPEPETNFPSPDTQPTPDFEVPPAVVMNFKKSLFPLNPCIV